MRSSLVLIGVLALALSGCGRLIPDAPGAPANTRPTPSPTPVGTSLIDERLDGGTRGRVERASDDYSRCLATLEAARVRFYPVPDRVNSATCGLTDAGQLGPDMGTVARMNAAEPTMTCGLALAVSVWRRQSVEPAAREILGSDVVQIDHMGTYACRNVNGAATGRPSAHSRAAALDFAGVRLRDGRRITVTGDWNGDDPEARYLRRIRDDACRIFGTVLSPDYNQAHHDHLHLEPGQAFCR